MRTLLFSILTLIWLADITGMVAIGQIGAHPFCFAGLYLFAFVLMILMVRWFPPNVNPNKSLVFIFVLGASARLVFVSYPISNDVYRYVWEGYIQNLGFNPFVFAPTSPALAKSAAADLHAIWQQINHPEFSAAYPPVTLLIFRALAWLQPNPLFFKKAMIIFDIGVMIILIQMIKRNGIAPAGLLLYAANPLVLVFIAGEGHLDVIQVFFLCLALDLILFRNYQFTGFLMLGLAVLAKYFSLIALPFLINSENRAKSLAVCIPLVLYIPYINAGAGLFRSLGAFGSSFHYNDSVTVVIRFLFGNLYLGVAAFLLVMCLIWVYLFVHDQQRSVYLAFGCLLLFLPTLHPWYLLLIAPFLVFYPSRAWLYLQAAVVFTFAVRAVEFKTGVFQEIHWLKWFEYIPFYGILIMAFLREGYLFRNVSFACPHSISIVIPSLNEADSLKRCLQSLKNQPTVKEIIVSDGGSTDATRDIADKAGVRVVNSPKGRGIQIEKGISKASGDVIVILHADCRAKKGIFERVMRVLATNPHIVGGAFGMQFEQKNLKTGLIAFLNNLRAILTGISFGDQAQFFRAAALEAAGGFPSIMLMEDVELSLRLKEVGRLVFLRDGTLVSDRRWSGNVFAGNLLTVLHLFTRYLIERRFFKVDRLMEDYYTIYYP